MYVNFSNIYVQTIGSKNTKHSVVLKETKDNKDKILSLCYPWVPDFQKSWKYQKYWKFGKNGKIFRFV